MNRLPTGLRTALLRTCQAVLVTALAAFARAEDSFDLHDRLGKITAPTW